MPKSDGSKSGGKKAISTEPEEPALDELNAALKQVRKERSAQVLTPEEEAVFASFKQQRTPTLEDLVEMAKHYPGLKITLSF